MRNIWILWITAKATGACTQLAFDTEAVARREAATLDATRYLATVRSVTLFEGDFRRG